MDIPINEIDFSRLNDGSVSISLETYNFMRDTIESLVTDFSEKKRFDKQFFIALAISFDAVGKEFDVDFSELMDYFRNKELYPIKGVEIKEEKGKRKLKLIKNEGNRIDDDGYSSVEQNTED